MSGSRRDAIMELLAVLDNDSRRGGATRDRLTVRQAAVADAAAARETFAYRQALLELAACAVGLAARLPAPAAPVPRVARGGGHRDDAPRTGAGRSLNGRRAA
jgi:hypothetical protein